MTDFQSAGAGMALSNAVADAVEKAAQVTVMVLARRRMPSSGIVFQTGFVLTADHTVERDDDLKIGLPDGSLVPASLAGRDKGTDLAVLRLGEGATISPAQLPGTSSGAPRLGHLVVAAGRPSPEGIQASLGMITGIGSNLRTGRGAVLEGYLTSDTVPLPGFSGGPLVNLAGEVIGINTSGLVRGASLAIPARLAFDTGANLAQHGHIRRGYLGIRSQQVDLAGQGGGQSSGLLVVGIEPDGPAAGGGLIVGDILTGLNGQVIATHDDLLVALAGDVVGRTVEIALQRGGQPVKVQMVIGEKK